LILASLLLFACAPATEGERVSVEEFTGPLSYYPRETGAAWEYLPDNARLDETPIVQRVEGPTVIDGDVWISWHMTGRGLDVSWFRQYRSAGVFLKREQRPGTIITFDPPIQEFPTENSLRVGLTWNGVTTAKLFFPDATADNQRREIQTEYRYTVVDRRSVTLAAGTFEVFVINFITRTVGDQGETTDEFRQELWFSPFVGEVRTENDFFLVGANFLEKPEGQN